MKASPITTMAVLAAFTGSAAPMTDSEWFDEGLSSLSGQTTDAGTWSRSSGDKSTISTADRKVSVSTQGKGEFKFKPTTSEDYNKATKLEFQKVVLSAFEDGGEWENLPSTSVLGGLSMRHRTDGQIVFIGWASTTDGSRVPGRWVELAADGVPAVDGASYDVSIESDYSCVPTRVRYSVYDTVLKDALGHEWFSVRQGSVDPATDHKKRMESVSFVGSGSVGTFKAITTTAVEPRTTITFGKVERPRAGKTVLTPEVTTNDEVQVAGTLQYVWYLTDAAGMRVVGSERSTEATYAPTKADYCHWVSVDVSDDNGYLGTGKFWFSNLPLVIINTKSSPVMSQLSTSASDKVAKAGVSYYWLDYLRDDTFQPITDIAPGESLQKYYDMGKKKNYVFKEVESVWPSRWKEDHSGTIQVLGNDQYKDMIADEMKLKIHTRGNTTAYQSKKPYKLKLDKKTAMFGLDGKDADNKDIKSKHWVLLANAQDESLLRNKVAYDFANEAGSLGMKCEWVDVVMNGQYVGNYLFGQHVRADEGRVEVFEWDTGKVAENAQIADPSLTDDDVDELDGQLEKDCNWITTSLFRYTGLETGTEKLYKVTKDKAAKDQVGMIDPETGAILVYWKEYTTDITGGYIFEIDHKKVAQSDGYAYDGAQFAPMFSNFAKSFNGGCGSVNFDIAVNTPEFCFSNATISNQVYAMWQEIAEAMTSGTGYNPTTGKHVFDLCDYKSMVGYYLVMEVFANNDAASHSRYAYKPHGEKMYFGPAWDFDHSTDALQIRILSNVTTNEYGERFYARPNANQFVPGAGANNFMGDWTADPYFSYLVREKYQELRPYLEDLVKDGGMIDQYVEKLSPSAKANDIRWNSWIGFNPLFEEERGDVQVFKDFLKEKLEFLDGKILAKTQAVAQNLTATVYSGDLRFRRASGVAPTVAGATSASTGDDISELQLTTGAEKVSVTVAVPDANTTDLLVYLNGAPCATAKIENKTATVEIDSQILVPGEKNYLTFVAKQGDINTKISTYPQVNMALLTANPTEMPAPDENGVVTLDGIVYAGNADKLAATKVLKFVGDGAALYLPTGMNASIARVYKDGVRVANGIYGAGSDLVVGQGELTVNAPGVIFIIK